MIPRDAADTLKRLAQGFPIIALTGPRQSGKTTLAKAVFAGKPYISLENPDEREFADRDPRRFLARFPDGAVLDEVQRCPALLSWLQGLVDERGRMGDFIVTGSAQFDLISGVTLDVGLLVWLVGIRDAESIATHAARGALFETWIVSEFVKQRYNAGQPADLYFWRDNTGHEVDLLYETSQGLQAIEIKSGSTFANDWLTPARKWQKFAGAEALTPILVYGGDASYEREAFRILGWMALAGSKPSMR